MSSVQAHSASSALELSNIPTTQSNFVATLNETEDTVQTLECKLTSRNCTAQPIIVQVEHIIRNKPKSITEKPQFGATLSSIRSKKCKSPKTNELAQDQEHKTIAAIIDLSSKDEEISGGTLKSPPTNLEETAQILENTINDPRLLSGADPQFQSSSVDSSIDDVAQALAKTPWRPHPIEDSQTEYEITCCGWKKVKKPIQKSGNSNGPWGFRPPGLNSINYPEKVSDQVSVDSNWPPELPENRINQADCFCIDHNEHCDDWVNDCLVSPTKNSTSEECYCHGPKMNIPLPIYEPEVEVLSAEYEEYVETLQKNEDSTKESKFKSKEKQNPVSCTCLMQEESLSLPKSQLTQDPIQMQSLYHDHCEPLIESQPYCEPLYQEHYQEPCQEPYQEPYQESYQEHQATIRENSQKCGDSVKYQHLCEPLNVSNQGDSFSTQYNNYEKVMPFTSSALTPEGDSFNLKPEVKPETRHETWQSSHKSLEIIPPPTPPLKGSESQIVFEENRELFSEYTSGDDSFNIYSDEALSSKLAEKMIKKMHPPSPPTGKTEYYNKTSFNVYSEEALNSKLSEKVHKKKPSPSPPIGRKEFSNDLTVQSKTKTSATQSENESMTNQSATSPRLKVVFSPDENWKKNPKLVSPTVAEGSDEVEHKPKLNFLKNEQASPSGWIVENDEIESLGPSPSITLPPTPEKRRSPEVGEIHESPMSEYMTPSPKFRTVKSLNSPDSQHHRSLSKGSQEFFESQRYPTPMELQNAPCMSVPEVQFDMKKVPECPPEVPKCVDKVPRYIDVASCFQEVPRCYDVPTCPESSSCHKMWAYDRDSNNILSGVPSCHCLAPDADNLFDAKQLHLLKKRKCDKPPSEPLPEVKKLCSPSGHINKSQPSVHLESTITEDKTPFLCQEFKTKNNQSIYICESVDDESNLQSSFMKQNQHYQQKPQFQSNLHFAQNPFELLKQPYNAPDNQNLHQNSMSFPENQNILNNTLNGSPSQIQNTMERISPNTRMARENKQMKRLNPWLHNENLQSFKNVQVSQEWVQPQFELNQQPVNSLIHACDFVHPENLNYLPTSPCRLVSHQPSTPPVTLQKPFCHGVSNQHSLLRQPSVCDLVLTKPIHTSPCRKKYFHNCRQQQSPQCYDPEVCQETPTQDSFHDNYESKCDSPLKKSKSRMSSLQPASEKKQSKSSEIITKKVCSVQQQEKELYLEEEYAEHLNINPDLVQRGKNTFISPNLCRHHSSLSLVDESHPGMCMTPRRQTQPENNNQIPKLKRFHSRSINWDWHPQAIVTCTSKVKPSLKLSRSTVRSYSPVNLKPSEKSMTQSLERYSDEPRLSQSSVRSYSFINQKPTEQLMTQHNFEIYSEEPKQYKSKKYHECSTTCNAEQCIPSSRFQSSATHQECTMPFSAMSFTGKPSNAIRHYTLQTPGPVSHMQCPSSPGSNVQCPSNLVSHMQCPSNLVSHMQCPSSSIPLVQDPLNPVPQMHCPSSPAPQMHCPSSPAPQMHCPSSPVSQVQCSSNPVMYEQCQSSAALHVQNTSSPAPYMQNQSSSIPYMQNQSSSIPYMQNQSSSIPYMQSPTMINKQQQVPIKCVENLPLSYQQQLTPCAYAMINTELNPPTMQQNIPQPSKEKQNVPTTQLVNAGVQYSSSSNAILETHNNRLTRPLLPNTAATQQQSSSQKQVVVQPKGKVTTIPQVTSETKLSINQPQYYESKTKIYQNQQTQTFETMEDSSHLILDSHYQLPKQYLSLYPRNKTVATETSEIDFSFSLNSIKKLLEESASKNITLISPTSNQQTNPSSSKTCHCHCKKSSIKIEPYACRKMSRQEVLPCCPSDIIKPKERRCKSNRCAVVSSGSETQHQYSPMNPSQPTEEQLNVVKNSSLIHDHHYSMPGSADTESKNHKKKRRHHIHKNCSYVANSSTMSLPTANTQPRDSRCWYCRQPFDSPNSMPFRNENAMSTTMPVQSQPFGSVNTMSQPNYIRVAYIPLPCLPHNPQIVPRLMANNYPMYPYQYQYQIYDDYPLGEAATVSSSGSTKSSRDTQSSRQHVCAPKEYRDQHRRLEMCSCHSDRESDYSDADSGCVTPTPYDSKFSPESQDGCHCTQLSYVEGIREEQDDEHEEVVYYDTIEPGIEKMTEEENVEETKRYCSLSKLHGSNDEVEESVEQIANPEQKFHSCRCSVEGDLSKPMTCPQLKLQRPMFSPLSPPLAHPVSTSQSLPTEFDQVLKGQRTIRFKKSPRCNKSPVMDSGSGRAAMETTSSHLHAISSVSEPLINGYQLTQDGHNPPTWSKRRSHYHRCVEAKNLNQFTSVSPSKIPEEKPICYNGCNTPKSPRLKYACSVLAFNTSPTSQGDPSSVECRQVSPDFDRPSSTKRWTTPTDVNIVEVVDDDEIQGEN